VANQLKMATVANILTLWRHGISQRQIAHKLDVNRDTVARYIRRERSKSAIPPAGSEGSGGSNPAIPPPGSQGRISRCEAFKDVVQEKIYHGLSGVRIWQDLCHEHGFSGSYCSVKRFVRRLDQRGELPNRRMECRPGEEAQVDFGKGAPVEMPSGRRKRTHVLRVILSHSRKGYTEAVWHQDTESVIRCLENAFHHFGGVPKTLVIDNLKAAVKNPDWYDPEINPKMEAFCRHYRTVVLPTKPGTPRHKGKVEGGVKYVQNNALKARTFKDLASQNRFLAEWEERVADHRIHGTTRRQVIKSFEERERETLIELPPDLFPSFEEGRRKVHRDGHVEVKCAYYSVPPEYTRRSVWARWDGRTVRVFNDRFDQIAIHAQVDAGVFSTDSGHIPREKRSGVERGAEWLQRRAGLIGEESDRWSRALLESRPIAGTRVLQGFLVLAGKYPAERIEEACRLAHQHGCYRLKPLKQLLKRPAEQPDFEFMQEHPLIRDMSEYALSAGGSDNWGSGTAFEENSGFKEEDKEHERDIGCNAQEASPVGHDGGPGCPYPGGIGQSAQP